MKGQSLTDFLPNIGGKKLADKDNKPTEKNENKIKELLSEFKKSDIQPFKDNNLFKDYTEIFKEIEFNFYLDFAEKFDFAEKTNNIYYGKKELTIILENKYKNEQDEDEKQKICYGRRPF